MSKKPQKHEQPLVSIVILSWNTLDDTKACLENLHELDYYNKEIVVVDNGSEDGSKKYLSSLTNIIYIDLPHNTGFTGGQIEALKVAKGDYLALINSDAILAKDWLNILIQEFEADKSLAAAGGRAYAWNKEHKALDTTSPFYSYQVIDSRRGYASTMQTGEEKLTVHSISGAAVLLRRSSIEKVGYFDNRFFAYFEETDLFARMRRHGYKILYVPEAHAWHKIAQSTKSQPWFYLYQMHRNRAIFAMKNFDTWQAWRFAFLYTFDAFKALIKYLRHRELDNMARLKAWWWNLIHLFPTLYSRLSVQKIGNTYTDILQSTPRGNDVTVIIPCYNYEIYVNEAIESVLSQTVQPHRIIAIDDGSTDGTLKSLSKYKGRIEIISKKNEGVVPTKNLGLSLVTTNWTIFFDADDVLEPHYIETLLNLARKRSADVVYTDMKYFGSKKGVHKSGKFSMRRLVKSNFIHNSALISTDYLKQVGGYKSEMSGGYEDWELYISLAEAKAKFEYVPKPIFHYRQKSLSRNSSAEAKALKLYEMVKSLHPQTFSYYTGVTGRLRQAIATVYEHPYILFIAAYTLPIALLAGVRGYLVSFKRSFSYRIRTYIHNKSNDLDD